VSPSEPSAPPLLAPVQQAERIQMAGVSYADILMAEGVHPETPAGPFIPGPRTTGQRLCRRQAGADLRS
jgi:D-arabinose 1-dehydrogenase-like Zn-dependent alcohol dehydrogenase